MTDAPLELSDADFAEDAPPGYFSQRGKEQFATRMIVLLVIVFFAQNVAPFVIGIIAGPMLMFQTISQGVTQYAKMTAWQDALWYPGVGGQGGAFRGGCQLLPLDYQGKKLDRAAIDLDMQPEWLLADGKRLWAVSKNEVAEVLSDGTRPEVMRPTRFLLHPSRPFLYEGSLAIVDRDEDGPFTLFLFEHGEWNAHVELALPDFSAAISNQVDEDVPADALEPDNALSPEAVLDRQRIAAQAFIAGPPQEIAQVQVVRIDDVFHVVFEQQSKLYHREGLPVEGNENPAEQRRQWNKIDARLNAARGVAFPAPTTSPPNPWALTAVGGSPAVLSLTYDPQGAAQLWRWANGGWPMAASLRMPGGNFNSQLTAFTTSDGGRTFAVIERMNGLTHDLLELKPDTIEKILSFGDFVKMQDPFSGPMRWYQLAAQIFANGAMLVEILFVTWLMAVYRVPNYYKGRTPVAYASVLRRCCAVLVDIAIGWGPVYAGWYYWSTQTDMTFARFMEMLQTDDWSGLKTFALSLVPGLLATMGWFLFCEIVEWLLLSFFGWTIGKFVCSVRVTQTNLKPPGLLRGLIRLLLSWVEIPILNGIVAFALVAFTQNRQRLADLVAGTIVLRAGSVRAARRAMMPVPTDAS